MSKRSTFFPLSLFALLSILFVSAASVSAQVTTVMISGTVNDTAGAVVPNAQVTAINTETIVNLNNPVTGRNSGQFGQIRDARTMREIQLGLRLTF